MCITVKAHNKPSMQILEFCTSLFIDMSTEHFGRIYVSPIMTSLEKAREKGTISIYRWTTLEWKMGIS